MQRLPTKPIESAHIHFAGEKNAGIGQADFDMSVFIDPACFDEKEIGSILAETRLKISKLYEEIQGSVPTWVAFDFEIPEYSV